MTEVAYTNIQPKTKINVLLSDPFTSSSRVSTLILLNITVTVGLAILFDADARIKGVKYHTMKLKSKFCQLHHHFS